MGFHEVNKADQEKMAEEFYRIIKPGGKLVVWELSLDQQTQPIFSAIIRKKDELSGFGSLVRNRYFPTETDTSTLLSRVGFSPVTVEHHIQPTLSIRNRKEELISAERLQILREKGILGDLDNARLEEIAEDRIRALRDYIRGTLSPEEKVLMGYIETETDTTLSASKSIFRGIKPTSEKTPHHSV